MKKTVCTKVLSFILAVVMVAAMAVTMMVGVAAEDAPVTKIKSASIVINEGIALRYRATVAADVLGEGEKVAMQFTMAGVTSDYVDGKLSGGEYVFTYEDIAPHFMSTLVDAKLVVLNADDELVTVLAEKNGYSVKQYAQSILTKYAADANLVQFISNMLAYGAAAQTYKAYNVENLATDGVEGMVAPVEYLPTATDRDYTPALDGKANFKSVGVWFGDTVKIYVRTSTAENVTVKIADKECPVTDTTFYSDTILISDFDKEYTFKLYDNGKFVQVLTYSVRSYVYSKMNQTEADGVTLTDMAKLCRALYSYGKAIEVYQAALSAN